MGPRDRQICGPPTVDRKENLRESVKSVENASVCRGFVECGTILTKLYPQISQIDADWDGALEH
jgi:hypothetical protein